MDLLQNRLIEGFCDLPASFGHFRGGRGVKPVVELGELFPVFFQKGGRFAGVPRQRVPFRIYPVKGLPHAALVLEGPGNANGPADVQLVGVKEDFRLNGGWFPALAEPVGEDTGGNMGNPGFVSAQLRKEPAGHLSACFGVAHLRVGILLFPADVVEQAGGR